MDNFDLKKYLIENKLTKNSLLVEAIHQAGSERFISDFTELIEDIFTITDFKREPAASIHFMGKDGKKWNELRPGRYGESLLYDYIMKDEKAKNYIQSLNNQNLNLDNKTLVDLIKKKAKEFYNTLEKQDKQLSELDLGDLATSYKFIGGGVGSPKVKYQGKEYFAIVSADTNDFFEPSDLSKEFQAAGTDEDSFVILSPYDLEYGQNLDSEQIKDGLGKGYIITDKSKVEKLKSLDKDMETGYENVPDDKLMKMYNEMATNKYNMSIHVANQFVELEKEARKRGLLKNFDNFPSF